MSQLALPLKLQDYAVFESYQQDGNEGLISFLENTVATGVGPGAWIRGATSTGKSHLLQAICARAADQAQYVPMTEFVAGDPAILDGLASRKFICLDDVEQVGGLANWELALFNLYNALAEAEGVLICAANSSPRDCGFNLPDLVSRLSLLPLFSINALSDTQRVAALQLRARHRGLELPTDAANYLIARSARDMTSLYELLDRLDSEALIAQRRLTIPFIRGVLMDNVNAEMRPD